MAMTVLNNTSAMMTLGELNKNINRLGKDLKKVSTGTKITSAQDDASGYAISERMRVMMRSLGQDEQNVKNGRFLLHVAAGGIDNIVEELRNLKKLALNAANDHNTDADRATIQKEFDQKMANINDIASETNYNGKILLDGRYGRKTRSSAESLWVASQTEPTSDNPIMIYSGNYTIAADGVYMLADGYTGTVEIANDVKNVEIQQESPRTALNEAFIVGPSTGNVNLWISGLNIENLTDKNIIKFRGTDNILTVKGDNQLVRTATSPFDPFDSDTHGLYKAVINVGDGLTVEGLDDSELNITMDGNGSPNGYDISARSSNSGAGIGSDDYPSSDASIHINSGNINVTMKDGPTGAGIGSGSTGGIGDIIITGGNIRIRMQNAPNESQAGAGIGSGDRGDAGNIKIDNATVDVISLGGAGIGSGFAGNVGDIEIGNTATINSTSTKSGAGIGSGLGMSGRYPIPATAGDITISRQASVVADSIETTWFGTQASQGAAIGAGQYSTVGNIIYVDDLTISSNSPTSSVSNNSLNSVFMGNPLVIHHGPKANQALNVYINDMRTDAMGLSGTKVTTREAAIQALSDDSTDPPRIGAIDAAIEYALNEATNVGAYMSRLEYTEENIVTANENTQASESTIRDADMAKEMMSYTKNNVLAQASQSMLAQANQTAGNVLSLLQ